MAESIFAGTNAKCKYDKGVYMIKNFTTDATDADVYDVATALNSLQIITLDNIQRVNAYKIVDIG